MGKLICGVGINDADYKLSTTRNYITVVCDYYKRWVGMINRCYGSRESGNLNSYDECEVCDEWLRFSAFKSWMRSQNWNGLELDKDLKSYGNKIYSPETCMFVPPKINKMLIRLSLGDMNLKSVRIKKAALEQSDPLKSLLIKLSEDILK